MKISLKRRTAVRCISFALATLAVLGGCILQKHTQANGYKTQLQYGYSRSLEELTATLSNIHIALEKGIYANTPTQMSSLSAQLLKEAGTAKTALSMLPPAGEELTVVNRFLSQVGDYALYLTQKTIAGNQPTAQERQSLQDLSAVAGSLSQSMEQIRLKFDTQGVWDADIDQSVVDEGFGDSMVELEGTLTDYPTLIYDGPFSDHMLTGTSKMLEAATQVTREQARQNAADALGIPAEQLLDDSDEEGKMPSYGFATDNTVVSVTKQGGYVVYFRNYRTVGEPRLSYEQAVSKAKNYLNGEGQNTFEESYYFADEGICVVNFAHKEGATVCYPDLVKVGVALDTGEVVFYEGRGYIMNHYTRTIVTPKYTVEQAQQVLSPNLSVQGVKQAIIPSGGNEERLCYEFLCTGLGGEEILVYIRTDTLQEQQILILLKTDGGTLTK